ncbi:MAG: peptidoglycan DD-metalloendopeptidase family protein [Negativicutes bacterium]|nr:peptidoglycan DD-metalloendopeptidase family protein [Negativicutes bacterium]
MITKFRRHIALAMAVLMLVAVGPALANEIDRHQQDLENIQRQIEAVQIKKQQAQQKVDSLAGKLQVIQTELDAALGDYNKIQSQLAYTEQQIETNKQILEKAEKNLAERSRVLNKRIRDIYEHGQVSYIDVLFGATDFVDFTVRMDLLKRVLQQDVALIARVKAERELVLQKKAELERDRAAIVELKKQAEAKKNVIAGRRNEQQMVLDAAVSERDANERAYRELLDTSRRIEQLIRNIQSGKGGTLGTGIMIWPASGPITSPFGWRTHPIFGTQRFHSGIDIGADYGDTVVAADGGVVIYADWMGGYGKAVIIDHGGGISTLYAHNSELLAGEGQKVYKGQPIARVGSTGYSTGPHLHFEVRQGGSPVSPMNYLP